MSRREQNEAIRTKKMSYTQETLIEDLNDMILQRYHIKEEEIGSEIMRELERVVLLRVVDEKWMDHIDTIDQLRHGIGLRGYAQRDPIIEYKFEAFEMFDEMIRNIKRDTLKLLLNVQLAPDGKVERKQVATPQQEIHGENTRQGGNGAKVTIKKGEKVGRNDPCPCGSGKKYKNCCGR